MLKRIPESNRWDGDVWKTFNVDLDKREGRVSLSRRITRIEDTNEIGNNTVNAFLRTNADCEERYWALHFNGALDKTDSAAFDTVVPNLDWDADGLDSSPGTKSYDMAVIGNDSRNDSGRNQLFVTTDCNIAVLNDTGNNAWTGSWWVGTHSQAVLNPNVFHPIEYFPFRKIGLVGDGNLVHTISRPSDTQNDTVTYGRLVLPNQYAIRSIVTTSDRAWFLCRHRFGGEGMIAEWDGFTVSANQFHRVYATAPMTGAAYGDIPIIINSSGQILEYNGAGFDQMERGGKKVAVPFLEDDNNGFNIGTDSGADWHVSPRGMIVGEDGLIYINMNTPIYASPRGLAGIWCLEPETGRFYNKYSLGRYTDSSVAYDFGQQLIGNAGALYPIAQNVQQTTFLAGGRVRSSATVNQGGIWLMEGPGGSTTNRGYFITEYYQAEQVRERYDNLWARFKRFVTSGNSIIIKARGVRPMIDSTGAPVQKTITWTAATTFTVTMSATDDTLEVGDEVEVLNGFNGGYSSHITAISGAHAALQTITVDETMPTTSGTAVARFDRWKKLGSITSTSVYEANLDIGISGSFIQLKVELRGVFREMEISDLIVNSEPEIYLKK